MNEMVEIKDLTDFQWLGRDGFYPISTMKTSHLFYTVRMIWNHTVPEKFKLKPYNKYRFGSFYSTSYMGQAVREMIKELKQRDDLADYMLVQLNFMFGIIKQIEGGDNV